MPTRYQLDKVLANRIRGGYEGENHSEYTIPSCGLEDVDKAVNSARKAFKTTPWGKLSVEKRIEILEI